MKEKTWRGELKRLKIFLHLFLEIMVNKVNLRTDRMSRSPAACDKCTRQCVIVHRDKNRSYAVIYGFFKFMHGKDCGNVLYLPPKYARTVKHLVSKEAELEDSNGDEWPVTFSNVNGSLSLQKGWAKFFGEHNLEPGDVLVFNCMSECHFIVHIYDKSACRIYDFSPRRPQKNKRCKANPIIADEEDNCRSVEKNSKDKSYLNTQYVPASQISNGHNNVTGSNVPNDNCQSVEKNTEDKSNLITQYVPPQISNGHNNVTGNIVPKDVGNSQIEPTNIILEEDPICMLNRDVDYPVEDRILQDLSYFEMKKPTSNANDFEKTLEGAFPPHDDIVMDDGLLTNQLHEEPADYGNCLHDLSCLELKKTAGANDFDKFLEGAITPHDDTEMLDEFFTDQFHDKLSDNAKFITSMQVDADLSLNDGDGILTSVAESPFISSNHFLGPEQDNYSRPMSFAYNYSSAEQVSSIKKELVESRERGKIPTLESLPITSSQFLSSMLNIAPAEQVSSIKKELVESREKGKAPTHVSLPITPTPLLCSMLNIAPESREKGKAPTTVSLPIISTQLLCSMLNIGPAKQVSSLTKELVESGEKGQALTHASLPNTGTDLLRSMPNITPANVKKDLKKSRVEGNLPTRGTKSGQTSSTAVKIEPDILHNTVPSVATTPFCAQVKSLHYLELPVCIPWSTQQKGDIGQVVFLRDPPGKLWPVLHPDLFCVRAFTGNWINLCEANHVEPGDVCQFQLESNDSSSSCIYRVDVQKSGQCFGK